MTALSLLLASAAMAGAPTSAATEAEVWALVRKVNSVPAYQVYLNRFPAGEHSDEALAISLRLEGLTARPTPPAPPAPPPSPMFLPATADPCNTMLTNQAGDSEEARAYKAATRTNRLADFRAYLRDYPGGACRETAEQAIGSRELRRQAVRAVAGLGPLAPHRLTQNFLTDLDYPASALRAGEAGRVVAEWEVAEDGVVEGCRITKPSGSTALDSATCRLVTGRLRYDPARDPAGRPARSADIMTIDWLLPPD